MPVIKNPDPDPEKKYLFYCRRCSFNFSERVPFYYIPPFMISRLSKFRTFQCCKCGLQVRRNILKKLCLAWCPNNLTAPFLFFFLSFFLFYIDLAAVIHTEISITSFFQFFYFPAFITISFYHLKLKRARTDSELPYIALKEKLR